MVSLDATDDIDDFDLETLLDAEALHRRYNAIDYMYEEGGPFPLEAYPKHAEIFEAGAKYDHRAAFGGNGVGKTLGIGGFEVAMHATGLYPKWWKGLRFTTAIKIRCCGDTRQTMREVIQPVLLGDFAEKGEEEFGTGLIPRHLLARPRIVPNTNGLVDFVKVKHISGNWSTVQFRAYEQGRKAFQGTKFSFIWEDEEPPVKIHEENVQRTRGVEGRILLTFTPLSGFSEVVENFMGYEKANREGASRYLVIISWSDVPHLSEAWKRKTLAEMRPHMRKTRMSGVPSAGIGSVYPVEEEFITVAPFPIPAHFRRVGGFDHGWHNTAALWLAYDKDEDVAYVYADYKRGEISIEQHAIALKIRGNWIPMMGDSSARDSDGLQIINKYKALDIPMHLPDKAVDAGIQEVFSRLDSGRLKIFSTCVKTLDEIRRYRYKEGVFGVAQIVKEHDHLMDALRYAIYSGLAKAVVQMKGRTGDITSNLNL